MSDLNRKPHTKAFFEKYKKLLDKFLDSWRAIADAKKLRWSPPGYLNGLMAEFLGEALELGAITINNPSDLEEVEKAGKSLVSWLTACTVDGFPVGASMDGNILTVSIGGATPNKFSMKVTSAKIE